MERIEMLSPEMIGLWAAKWSQTGITAIWCLTQLDALFDGPQQNIQDISDRFLKRWESLDSEAVSRWSRRAGVDPFLAKVALIQQSELFSEDRFVSAVC